MFDENYSTKRGITLRKWLFGKKEVQFRRADAVEALLWCGSTIINDYFSFASEWVHFDVTSQLLIVNGPSRALHIKQRFSVLNTTEAAAERRLRRRPMRLLLASNKKWGQHAPTTAVTDLIHECSPFLYYIYTMLDHKHKNVPSAPLVFLWA